MSVGPRYTIAEAENLALLAGIRQSLGKRSLKEINTFTEGEGRQMAKFYVQSGNIKSVVSADEAEKAALWIVHQTLQQVVPVYEDAELTPQEKGDVALVQGIMVLGNQMQISEKGFDREDAEYIDTFDLLVHWHQLMIALDRLSEQLRTTAGSSSA